MRWWLLPVIIIWMTAGNVYGASAEQSETLDITEGLLGELNLTDLDRIVKEMIQTDEISFSDMIEKLALGEWNLDVETLTKMLGKVFFQEVLDQKDIIMELFLLILSASFLFQLSYLFEKGQMTNVTFYVIYLMAFALLMKSFGSILGQAKSVIGTMSSFMKVLTPAYFLAITASNGSMTASAYYQIVLFTITLIQNIFLKAGLWGIQIYVVLGIVNDLSEEDLLSKMAELIKTVVAWLIRSVTGIIVGLQVIQKMIAPAMDLVKRGLVGKTASAIPGIGNVFDSVTEMTIGCAVLVRNCLGAAALVVLVLFGLGPVIQMGVTALLYRLMAAVMQPVSDKRLIQAVTVMAEGCGLLLRMLVTSEILFLLTIAIIATGGSY